MKSIWLSKLYNILFFLFVLLLLIFVLNYLANQPKKEYFNNNNNNNNNNYCCVYAYYEKNDLYKTNFQYFLENGLLDNVDYYIIINGNCSVILPDNPNIKILKRENKGFDFGAYSYAIKHMDKKYDYYFFLNTSVKGPYVRDKTKPWIHYFLELFNKPEVKIVGTSINIYHSSIYVVDLDKIYGNKPPHTHIQSMFFCMNNEYFEYLKSKNFFNEEELNNTTDINYVIAHKEFGLSQLALTNNWNINSILPKYRDIDYRRVTQDFNPTSTNGDPYYDGAYFGENINEYDAIFFKNNRF